MTMTLPNPTLELDLNLPRVASVAPACTLVDPLEELGLFAGDAFYDLSPVSVDCPQCPAGGFVVPYRAEHGVVVELRCLHHQGNFAGTR